MPHIDDIKMMLTALLKASKINLADKESNSQLKADDGFDNDNPLAQTELYRDEQGNRLPSKLHVIPIFGRPILPSQITTLQLNNDWLDTITDVISSSHHTFALFALKPEQMKNHKISTHDFPQTGTVIRLLSARAGHDEIDLICEGVRRVSLIELVDPQLSIARVRYPEIEYQLANPTTRDKLFANAKSLRQSLDDTVAFEKKLKEKLRQQRDYAQSLGLKRTITDRIEKDPNAPVNFPLHVLPNITLDFTYHLIHNEHAIGRISRNKLRSMLEFLGLKLSDEQQEQLAIYLATPSASEMAQLNQYTHDIQALIAAHYHQVQTDIKNMPENMAESMAKIGKLLNQQPNKDEAAAQTQSQASAGNTSATAENTSAAAGNTSATTNDASAPAHGFTVPPVLLDLSNISDTNADTTTAPAAPAASSAAENTAGTSGASGDAGAAATTATVVTSDNEAGAANHNGNGESEGNKNDSEVSETNEASETDDHAHTAESHHTPSLSELNFEAVNAAWQDRHTKAENEQQFLIKSPLTTSLNSKSPNNELNHSILAKIATLLDPQHAEGAASGSTANANTAAATTAAIDAKTQGAAGTGSTGAAGDAMGAVEAAGTAATAAAADATDAADAAEQAAARREELFALIAKVGSEEEQALQQAQEKFKEAALKEILNNVKQNNADDSEDAGDSEVVTGPNIGFINEDTSVVTFMPGQESSEELLLRLNEIQKEQEAQLQKISAQVTQESSKAKAGRKGSAGKTNVAAEADTAGAGAGASSTGSGATGADSTGAGIAGGVGGMGGMGDVGGIDGLDGLDGLDGIEEDAAATTATDDDGTDLLGNHEPQLIIDDNVVSDTEGSETNIIINTEEQQMPKELKEFLGFLMQGKDAADYEGEGDGKHNNKWSALQRAAIIRSKLAQLLGGKVVFGVSDLTNKHAAQAQKDVEMRAYCLGITTALQELLPLNPLMPEEMRQYLAHSDMNNPSVLADCAASITQSTPKELQQVLDTIPLLPRLKLSFELLTRELSAAKLQDKIKLSVAEKIQKRQKDFFLREQLTEIKKELGLSADEKDLDVEKFRERMKKLSPPEHIEKRFKEELDKLSMLETASPEYGLTHNYLDVITTIPWGKLSKEKLSPSNKSSHAQSLERARKILDQDHEGLQDVKDRIIEFLAVGSFKGQSGGQIMLFVGPPGVGKTSIGKSIARALNRPFYRLSLGGIDDVSEIKGHRKTYVGAMAGKIVAALRETKVMNPVIMLDEIDKLGHSYHGDPDSALLETLDPEQNKNFLDVYLDEKIDLSQCLFICTANSTDTISPPLLDRMEPIRLSGYIAKEKFAIAQNHLLPRALEAAGLKGKRNIQIPDATMQAIIDGYARESGVRSLERAIAKLIRKAAVHLIAGEKKVVIREQDLEEYLGTAPFKKEKMLQGVGIMTGLAWTASGGVTLPVESIVTNHDAKNFQLTGSLGDVMKESAAIAYSFVQSHLENYNKLKKDATFFKKKSIHLHVPEGAIPKDGPSAGVTMATSLLSLALNEAPRQGFAMTGELTLTGHVLPIGGLREKVIAARRMGLFDLVIPIGNEGDVKELPEQVRSKVTFYYADTYSDVAYTLFPSVQELMQQQGFPAPRSVHFDASGNDSAAAAAAANAATTATGSAKTTGKAKAIKADKTAKAAGSAKAKTAKAPAAKTTKASKATKETKATPDDNTAPADTTPSPTVKTAKAAKTTKTAKTTKPKASSAKKKAQAVPATPANPAPATSTASATAANEPTAPEANASAAVNAAPTQAKAKVATKTRGKKASQASKVSKASKEVTAAPADTKPTEPVAEAKPKTTTKPKAKASTKAKAKAAPQAQTAKAPKDAPATEAPVKPAKASTAAKPSNAAKTKVAKAPKTAKTAKSSKTASAPKAGRATKKKPESND